MDFRPGDVLACFGRDWSSRLITAWTCGPSHVGVVCAPDPAWGCGAAPVLVESTSFCDRPCRYRGEKVAGVQVQDPHARVRDYGGRVDVWRLLPDEALADGESRLLTALLDRRLREATPYDFAGAAKAGTRVLKFCVYPDAHSVFCSELVARAFMRLGRLRRGNPEGYTPGRLVRELRRCNVAEKVEEYPCAA